MCKFLKRRILLLISNLDRVSFGLCDIENMANFSPQKRKKKKSSKNWWNFHFLKMYPKNSQFLK
jgi:hypothetical protein